MTGPLVTVEEVLDKAWEIIGGDALRVWYEDLLAERKERRDNVRIGKYADVTITVGKRYDLTLFQSVRKPHSFEREDRETKLRGWTFLGEADWSFSHQYLRLQKNPEGKDWGGAIREVRADLILNAVEVTA